MESCHHICPNPEGPASNRESGQRRSVIPFFQLFEGLFSVAPRSNASHPVRQLPRPLAPFLMTYRKLVPRRKLTPGSQFTALPVITQKSGTREISANKSQQFHDISCCHNYQQECQRLCLYGAYPLEHNPTSIYTYRRCQNPASQQVQCLPKFPSNKH